MTWRGCVWMKKVFFNPLLIIIIKTYAPKQSCQDSSKSHQIFSLSFELHGREYADMQLLWNGFLVFFLLVSSERPHYLVRKVKSAVTWPVLTQVRGLLISTHLINHFHFQYFLAKYVYWIELQKPNILLRNNSVVPWHRDDIALKYTKNSVAVVL